MGHFQHGIGCTDRHPHCRAGWRLLRHRDHRERWQGIKVAGCIQHQRLPARRWRGFGHAVLVRSHQNTDGSAITDLGGYVIYHGVSPNALTSTVRISNPGISSYVIDNIPVGTHYFALAAFNASGVEGARTAVGSKNIL